VQQLYISVGCSNCIYALIVMCMHALLSIYVVHAGHTFGDYVLSDYLNVLINVWCTCVNKLFYLDL